MSPMLVPLALILAPVQTTVLERSAERLAEPPALVALRRHLLAEESMLPRTVASAVADFDGDGDLDVLTGWHFETELHTNRGGGVFRSEGRFPTDSGPLLAGDLDGDGDVDFVRGFGLASPELWRNDGRGRFVLAAGAFPSTLLPSRFGDLDGDGDLDGIAVASGSLVVLTNAGGTFTSNVVAAAPFVVRGRLELFDVDGDGALDVLVPAEGQTGLFLGDGAGGFTDATAGLPADAAETWAVAVGDVDGDGDLDAVLGNTTENCVWLGAGDGTFTVAANALPPLAVWTRDLALFDADGDGDLDLYEANYSPPPELLLPVSAADVLWTNDGSGVFQPASASLPTPPDPSDRVVVEDLDGDGDQDLLVSTPGTLRLLLGDGAGAFWLDDGGVSARNGYDTSVALGDVDGDGWTDAVAVSDDTFHGGVHARFLRGDGTGRFTDDPAVFSSAARPARGAALGDVDGDGDLDLALANPYDDAFQPSRPQDNQLYRNAGGVLADVSASALPTHGGDDRGVTQAVHLTDLDLDGDLDLLYPELRDFDGGGGEVTFYRNDGTGKFADATAGALSAPNRGSVLHLQILDLEGDGDPDLAVAQADPPFGLYLLENDGSGSFTDLGALPGSASTTQVAWTAAADFDGDGDVDLAGADLFATHRFFGLNDGRGGFVNAPGRLSPQALSGEPFAPADVDGDGDPDLVGPRSLLENDGTGRLEWRHRRIEGPRGLRSADATAIAFGDLDADGDLDAFWAAAHDAVGSNPTRHLAATGLPRIGRILQLDVFGPAGQPWLLASSINRVNLPTPFGRLQLDPASLTVVAFGQADVRGRASWSTSVPNDPSLVGATSNWQALVGVAARLTNLERTVVTAY